MSYKDGYRSRALVCISRVYVGGHYPLDVIGGILLGARILLLAIFIASPVAYIMAQQQQQHQEMIISSKLFKYINANSTSGLMNGSMSSMMARGNIAMGFNQSKIMHHFIATPTGGEIMIVALSNDIGTIKQIRNHVLDIQKEFSQGNFTKPFFIHAQQVPGTKLMAEKKDLIRYSIKQINNGSILLLTTSDRHLVAAIHQFIAFQTAQHSEH